MRRDDFAPALTYRRVACQRRWASWRFCYAIHGCGVTPHCRQPGCANCPGACATLPVRSGRGVFRSSLPGPVTSCSGVLSTLRRDARVADLTTSFVAALFTLRTALRPCHPCPVHTKNCSSVSWSGPACPPVFPARAPAAACCPLCSRACSVSPSSRRFPCLSAAWLSSFALVSSLFALLRRSLASVSSPFSAFRWPRSRRSGLAPFGLSARLLPLFVLAVGGSAPLPLLACSLLL